MFNLIARKVRVVVAGVKLPIDLTGTGTGWLSEGVTEVVATAG